MLNVAESESERTNTFSAHSKQLRVSNSSEKGRRLSSMGMSSRPRYEVVCSSF